jgi:hypothetical protein
VTLAHRTRPSINLVWKRRFFTLSRRLSAALLTLAPNIILRRGAAARIADKHSQSCLTAPILGKHSDRCRRDLCKRARRSLNFQSPSEIAVDCTDRMTEHLLAHGRYGFSQQTEHGAGGRGLCGQHGILPPAGVQLTPQLFHSLSPDADFTALPHRLTPAAPSARHAARAAPPASTTRELSIRYSGCE